MEIVLPWPDPVLNPNRREHWAEKHKARKRAKFDAYYATQSAGYHRVEWPEGRLFIWMDAYPPDRRRRDADNLLASLKGSMDGIAEALRVDDRRFVPRPYVMDEVRKGGEVRIRITPGPEAG